MNSNAFTKNSEINQRILNKTELPPLNLKLPEFTEIMIDGRPMFAYDVEGFTTILHIANGYFIWTQNYPYELKLRESFKYSLGLCSKQVKLYKGSLDILSKDNEKAYNLFFEEREAKNRQDKMKLLKTILWTAGGIVVGAAIGTVVGFAAAQ